jgi:SAM-dependent methyltransferase
MSQAAPRPAPILKEKTFSSYNREQANTYAKLRRDYHHSLYQTVLDHHTSTGGQLETFIDVGCGPGLATRGFAPHFAHGIGLDLSEGMISMARSLGLVASTSEQVRFELSTAEELGEKLSPPIEDSSVDLIIAANAAHWFDMTRFWPSAARVLKPGGTVALWTSGDIRAHPSMPNATAIQAAIHQNQDHHLLPYYEPGNLLTRNRYAGLPLPWTLAQPVTEFDASAFFRKDWGIGEEFFVGEPEVDLDTFELMNATASPVTRWRQAHPDLVGTERDVLKMLRREIELLLHEAGVERGKETVRGSVLGTLLVFKKKA